MNEEVLKGKWNKLKGHAKKKWGELTDDDLDRVDGSRDRLVGAIQERYGKEEEEAEMEVEKWSVTP